MQVKWIYDELWQDDSFVLKRTFSFTIKDLFDKSIVEKFSLRKVDEISEYPIGIDEIGEIEVEFVLGTLEGEYFKISRPIVLYHSNLYIHKDITINISLFIANSNISIFGFIEKLLKGDIYVGGQNPHSIPENAFLRLIKEFPTTHEKSLYARARVTTVLRDYFENVPDYNAKFQAYLNKRPSIKGADLQAELKNLEILKFETILAKLELMIASLDSYNEKQWQKEILQIIRLLYPKYIYAFENVPIQRRNKTNLFLDILLIDAGGYVDILEIKKPFESSILTHSTYRDNHIPYRELSGTIMQLEKYIYYLNRWGSKGEEHLSESFPQGLPDKFEVKLTNPGGLIIMGRDFNLSAGQKEDFEVVKRKYKNVIDIITYDELIRRLKFTIKLWQKID